MAELNHGEQILMGRIPVYVFENKEEASKVVAHKIARIIREKTEQGKTPVLGLATGSSPILVYKELVRMHKEEGLSFSNVVTFNLDEYYPMAPDDTESYVTFMHQHLFDQVDIKEENIHIPDGTLRPGEVDVFCERYEQQIDEFGGIDLQLLGIGRTGHIGFNEPGTTEDSKTRKVVLNEVTRKDAAPAFEGINNVPTEAITMGVASVFKAREIVLLAWGDKKASIVKKALQDEVSDQVPATYLQKAAKVQFVLDTEAAKELKP